MTGKERTKAVSALVLETDEQKRNAFIDELSEPDAREMLKIVFHAIRGEYTVDFKREGKTEKP